jgi:hypothetical protein
MVDILLNLTILPVGPRRAFEVQKDAVWRFALQVAVAFQGEPKDGKERAAWARAMLPAMALDAESPLKLSWAIFRSDAPLVRGDVNEARMEGGVTLTNGAQLDERLEQQYWPDFVLKTNEPPRVFGVSTSGRPDETSQAVMLLPAVLPSAGGAVPHLASATIKATWYFDITLDADQAEKIRTALADDDHHVGIAVWPQRFLDTRTNPAQAHTVLKDPWDFRPDQMLGIRYEEPVSDTSGVRAQTLRFSVHKLVATPEPVLKDYWFRTIDSRLDTLAEVHTLAEEALRPAALVGYLTPAVVIAAGIARPASTDPAADARLFLTIARKLFAEDREIDPAGPARVLKAALASKLAFTEALRAEIAREAAVWWTLKVVVDAVNTQALREHAIVDRPWTTASQPALLFRDFATFLVPGTIDVKPVLPGEGIDVLFGEAGKRLRHEDANDTANDSDHAQIAERGILVRRAPTKARLIQQPWSIATAGVLAFDADHELEEPERFWGSVIDPGQGVNDESIPYDPRPVVRGVTSGFTNRLATSDERYHGVPMITQTVGSALHGVNGMDERAPKLPPLLPLTMQPVGPVYRDQIAGHTSCLVPPLRYGDWYQFAGFVIDRAGGIPSDLALPAKAPLTCHFDWSSLDPGRLPALDVIDGAADQVIAQPIEFLRRVPVGEVNVRPPVDPKAPAARPEWPALPDGVTLRSREWLSSRTPKSESVPALLLSDSPEFSRRVPSLSFQVSAPVLDEHTVSRWMLPSAVDRSDPTEVAAARLRIAQVSDVVAAIHRSRAALENDIDWTQQRDVLPFDPAVAGIGLRALIVNDDGAVAASQTFLDLAATITVSLGERLGVTGNAVTLQPGTFMVLELCPLVAAADFGRFERLAMRDLIEEEPWIHTDGSSFIAFAPSRVLVEAATAAMPAARSIYDALALSVLDKGAVDVTLASADGQPLPGMAFVETFELPRQRWTWRNRPILLPGASGSQSELPRELSSPPAARDTALNVLRFDDLSSLDVGLVNRDTAKGRVPRAADGAPLPSVRLFTDTRDAVTHADYLRFGCVLVSRYRGILVPSKQAVRAESAHPVKENDAVSDEVRELEPRRFWRRVVAPFRGDLSALKAPKVLAVLPLTERLPLPQLEDVSDDATPFLVVLDEIWFREYGHGEQLGVEVVLETKEIGEEDSEKRPFRIGPLPDHYLVTHLLKAPFVNKRLYPESTDEEQQVPEHRRTFQAFGPFGYSLDRSGNEAVSNATAFVVYPPKIVRPHYAAFVRLRRVLRDAEGRFVKEGPPGSTYALYTQPDAKQVISVDPSGLRIEGARYTGARLGLPVAENAGGVMKQYRYLLIVGRGVRDFGRGEELVLPDRAAWITDGGDVTWAGGQSPSAGSYRGRVLEILLSGRFEPGASPLETQAPSLKAVFKSLFASGVLPEDAPGMIRRISGTTDVTVA